MSTTNLYTAGDGLFGTHVTLEDIEQDMQIALNTTASFGANVSVDDIGEYKSFMSRIVLVEPDWQPMDKELPEKLLVK
ncbi:hypothetical protein COOONC_14167, partial [Cooperia oncophora]